MKVVKEALGAIGWFAAIFFGALFFLGPPDLPLVDSPAERDIKRSLPTDVPDYVVPACAEYDCDCEHFGGHAHAQWFHDNYDPYDRHRLDGDDDGLACEPYP